MSHEAEFFNIATSELDFPLDSEPYSVAVSRLSGHAGENATTKQEFIDNMLFHIDDFSSFVDQKISELEQEAAETYVETEEGFDSAEPDYDVIRELWGLARRSQALDIERFRALAGADWDMQHDPDDDDAIAQFYAIYYERNVPAKMPASRPLSSADAEVKVVP